MYSSGLPFLYFVAFASFLISYWVDKLLFLCCYKRPPQYGSDLPKYAVGSFKYAVLLHFVVGYFMYSNSTILIVDSEFILDFT